VVVRVAVWIVGYSLIARWIQRKQRKELAAINASGASRQGTFSLLAETVTTKLELIAAVSGYDQPDRLEMTCRAHQASTSGEFGRR
jgi:hypothetical protein